MLEIAINNKPNIFPIKTKAPLPSANVSNIQNNHQIHFGSDVNFVLVNKFLPTVNKNVEFKHIYDVLKTLGVQELELGDNLTLARLLKSAMYRVKMAGFNVPTRIRCEAKYFNENEEIVNKKLQTKLRTGREIIIPGVTNWDGINDPLIYLNTEHPWGVKCYDNTQCEDFRHVIWHETGHFLHMQNYRNNPQAFEYLNYIYIDPSQKDIVHDTIGKYAAENAVPDTITEIFTRLLSGESYNKLHPEIFNIYSKYRGPMPKFQ